MNKCNIVRDLLPLYADEICSEDSKKLVEEHLSCCKTCRQEMEDYRSHSILSEVDTEQVIKRFRKKLAKKSMLKIVISVILCLLIVFSGYYILFVPEYVVPYKQGLVEANVPVDEGVDVWVKADNYLRVQTYDILNENGETDIYLTVMQNNFSKLFPDDDTTDNLWRTSGTSAVCYHSGHYYPLSGENPQVKNIYYLEMDPDDVLYMVDEISFDKYNPVLIWSAE